MPTEVHMARSSRLSSWGFRLTGGVTFNMPITVFEVQEGGYADRAGIRVGDVLLKINGKSTSKLALKEANTIIDKKETMDLEVTNLQDQEASELEEKMMGEYEEEEQQITHLDINSMNLPPPRPAPKPETAQRKCWHPVVLDTNPPPIIEETTGDEEAPHKKILRNFRQAMTHKNLDPSPERSIIKSMVFKETRTLMHHLYEDSFQEPLQGPPNEKPPPPPPESEIETEMTVEEQLRVMQRQLATLCQLPAVLQRSLAAVNEKICKLLPPENEPESETIEDESYDDLIEEEQSYEYLSREPTPEPEEEEESMQEPSEQEPESEPEITAEEIERLEKMRKMEELNRAWPWSNNVKPVYKLSDRYKVPHSEMFSKKIQRIESQMVLRKPHETVD